jgi:hypothetical protein
MHTHEWIFDVEAEIWKCVCGETKPSYWFKRCASCGRGIDELVSYSQHLHNRCVSKSVKRTW